MTQSALIPLAVILLVAIVLLALNHAEFRAVFRRRRDARRTRDE